MQKLIQLSIQYTLRDAAGQLLELGTRIPVHPEGFVMAQADIPPN